MFALRIVFAFVAASVGYLLVAPLALVWLCFEAVAYLTTQGARLFEEQVIASNELIEFAPTIGWKPRANLKAYYLTMVKDGVFNTVTDSEGWPDRSNISNSSVVVFGDSYAFGYGVNSCATFWRHTKACTVKAIGAPGYNMVQELLLMKQHSTELKGKIVIWFIYFGNDLYDNLVPNNQHYRSPFVRKSSHSSEWRVTTEHISPARWPNRGDPQYYDRLGEICSATMLSERAFSACEFLIAEAHKICIQAEATLVLMTIPDAVQLTSHGREKLARSIPNRESFDAALPDKQIKEFASKQGIPVVALAEHLTIADYKERDPHWNEQGHRRVAKVIAQVWENIALKSSLAPINELQATGHLASKVSTPQ